MKFIKEKIFVILGIVLCLVLCGGMLFYFEGKEEIYYTQIDNTRIEKLTVKDEMKYEYTLNSYDSSGRKKEINFKTNRELREFAYLKLEVLVSGVHSWEEVSYDELPPKVQEYYK